MCMVKYLLFARDARCGSTFLTKNLFRVRHLPLEDVADSVLPVFIEEEIYQSRLQIVLISPTFLEFIFRYKLKTS